MMTLTGATVSGHFSTTTSPYDERGRRKDRRTHHPVGKDLPPVKFCAVDGEGITLPNGEHRYVLLSVGQEQIDNPIGLRFTEIMEFLYENYRPGTAFVGFYLGYDFTQWFKTLPEERAWRLLTIPGRASRQRKVKSDHAIAPHPVEFAGWQFDILGSKRFRLRPKRCMCPHQSCKCKHAPWMYVCDAGGFFQTSFINVINPSKWINPIVTDDEFQTILEGKANRSNAVLDRDMRRYNLLENRLLERVMDEVNIGLGGLDVRLTPAQWFGPGQAAQQWLRNQKVVKRTEIEETVPEWALKAAMASYFGGWFEIFIHGLIPGNTHGYDINSAYPFIIASLPCLLHGTWEQGAGKPDLLPGQFCLVRARVWTQSPGRDNRKCHIGAMLHRDENGRIDRPLITEGWYWHHELEAAQRAKCIARLSNDRYYEWVKYSPCDCPPPIRRMANLYLLRLQIGKDSSLGKGAKLVYNSGYGKFAQSIGNPLFGNAIYASLITAGCRTMILDAIASHPGGKANVAMVATDAVYFLDEHPSIPGGIGDELGQWSHSIASNLTLFKPGVYWNDATRRQINAGQTPTFKARGINAAQFAGELAGIDEQFRAWPRGPVDSLEWPRVKFRPTFMMTTALQALIQGEWSRAGHVSFDTEVVQSSNPFEKRQSVYYDENRGIYRSEPYKFGGITCGWERKYVKGKIVCELRVASEPYTKRFGMEDPFSDESREVYGLSPDGYVSQAFIDILQGRETP